MTRRSITICVTAMLLLLGQAGGASAADIHVLCSLGFKAVLEELAPQFERATGNKVVVEFGLAATLKQQIEGGKDFDVAILTPAGVDDLIKQGKMAADSRAVIARTGLGLMIRSGAQKPDLSSTDAFKRALLGSKGIAFAKEGASGVAFVATVERLGMTETLKSKMKPTSTGEEVNALVLRGEADFGVLPLSEILPVKGAELGGMFPADVQTYITMAGAANPKSKQNEGAGAFLKFLMAPAATSVVKAKGMDRS